MTRSAESAEVNVSDYEYKVGHDKQNRPEKPIVGGVKNVKSVRYLNTLVVMGFWFLPTDL